MERKRSCPDMGIPIVERAGRHPDRVAVICEEGVFTYRDLLEASAAVASSLLDGAKDLKEERVAFLTHPGFDYAAIQWGIWQAGGIAVPLSLFHPRPELEYAIEDSASGIVTAHPELADRVRPIAADRGLRFLLTTDAMRGSRGSLPRVDPSRRAMIVYTSGTTGRPKGVVTTHRIISAQIEILVRAWEWVPEDSILLALPLHHVHGIINVLSCALWAGASCETAREFDAEDVWNRIARKDLTLFMAVPTIYVKLIQAWERAAPARQRSMSAGCKGMRLMVSGSAALPVRVLERWRSISGHTLLERYGMTEIGMALSNPLHGERRPGHVGFPLPRVAVRLVDEAGQPTAPGETGEIQVKGPGVFLEYWNRPEAVKESFRDGWFRTGDMAVMEEGSYRILGRRSVDIIKSGGYKVSALEIEEALREHPQIEEIAVVGVEDPTWGERVCAAVVPAEGSRLTLESLRAWAKERLAAYKAPTRMLTLDRLPRNAMGKVVKPKVTELFGKEE